MHSYIGGQYLHGCSNGIFRGGHSLHGRLAICHCLSHGKERNANMLRGFLVNI
jgi:hypothetical protein